MGLGMGEQTSSVERSTLDEQILQLLTEIVAGHHSFLGERDGVAVVSDAGVADLGIDSIDLSYVFAFAERQYGAAFDNNDLAASQYGTVSDLMETVWSRVTRGHD
jgi:acyl carrier protein